MNRREHSHLDAEASSVVFILTRNVIRQSLVRTRPPFGRPRSSRTLPPTFLFLQSSVFKEQTSHAQCHDLHRFWLQAFECRSRGSLDFVQLSRPPEANFFVASSVAAVVGEAYIDGSSATCQLRFPFFLFFGMIFSTRARRPFPSPWEGACNAAPAGPIPAAKGFETTRHDPRRCKRLHSSKALRTRRSLTWHAMTGKCRDTLKAKKPPGESNRS